MATVQKSPRNSGMPDTGNQPVSREQLRKDRMNMVLVLLVFGAIVALMMWLASMSPAPGNYNYGYPLVP